MGYVSFREGNGAYPQLVGGGFEQLVIFSSTWGKFEPNSTDIFKRVEIIVSAPIEVMSIASRILR